MGSTFKNADVTVTVIRYRRDVPNPYGKKAGQRLDALLVKTCVLRRSSTLSWSPWTIETADSAQFPSATEYYDTWPVPEYPFAGERVFKAGDCAKGWIEFYVGRKARIAQVVYAVDAGTHRWRVG
jgi:hypothetical protein